MDDPKECGLEARPGLIDAKSKGVIHPLRGGGGGRLKKPVRKLERDGLTDRPVHPQAPPRAGCALSLRGAGLEPGICGLKAWGPHAPAPIVDPDPQRKAR